MNDEVMLPTVDEVMEDPATSWWLKETLIRALIRDPVDALNDSLLLAGILDARLRETLGLDEPS